VILVADENVQLAVVVALRQKGYDVHSIREMARGIPDDSVLDVANQVGAILLTYDRDFGELVFQQKRVTGGVILVRLTGMPPVQMAEVIAAIVEAHGAELVGSFTVISSSGVRIRNLPI